MAKALVTEAGLHYPSRDKLDAIAAGHGSCDVWIAKVLVRYPAG